MNLLRITTIDEQRKIREKMEQIERDQPGFDLDAPSLEILRNIIQIQPEDERKDEGKVEKKPVDALQSSLKNLAAHLPGEATALYLTGINLFKDDASLLNLSIVTLVSLALMIIIRFLAGVAWKVLIISAVTFLIWIYAIGSGPFQALGLEMSGPMSAFLVIAYSTLITILMNNGIIKEPEPDDKN